jgi:hypothetical protein
VAPSTPEKGLIQGGPTGSFIDIAGGVVTIHNMNFAALPATFLAFDTAPALPSLDITSILSGVYGSGQCALSPAVGETCTPASGPYTFLNLVNNPPPAPLGPQATMTFVLSGVTSDGLSDWQATFTSQFVVPYQTLLAQLASTNSLSSSYAATVSVTARNVDRPQLPCRSPRPWSS